MLTTLAKHAIRFLPESAASSVTRVLAGMSVRPPISPMERNSMLRARRIAYGKGNKNVAWVWGEGPIVVLVHGWNGRAAQMAPLASRVADLGFRAIAIEVTGHGTSPGRYIRADYFLRDVAALSESLDEKVHAYIGHSAGALTIMAGRKLRGLRAAQYVCICAPSHPFPPIDLLKKKLNPKAPVLENYKTFLAGQLEDNWSNLETGISYVGAGTDLLLFYDETDKFVHHSEGDKIRALCPGAKIVKTAAYSHHKILAASELAEEMCEFLKPEKSTRPYSRPRRRDSSSPAAASY